MTEELSEFDAAEYLTTPEARAAFLQDALNSQDHGYLAAAIGVLLRAQGMGQVAKVTGKKRGVLYRAFAENGNPTLHTLMAGLDAVGLSLDVKVKGAPSRLTGSYEEMVGRT